MASFYERERDQDAEEEHVALQHSIQTLMSQVAAERSRREAAEREIELTAQENGALEQRLALLEGCRARQRELEAEVEELQLLWRADYVKRLDPSWVQRLQTVSNSMASAIVHILIL